jgi:hypothetical protein
MNFTRPIRLLGDDNMKESGPKMPSASTSAPAQITFMEQAGMPLRTEARKTYTVVEQDKRLGYLSLVDYTPGVEPYEHDTLIEFSSSGDGANVVMTMETMHDEDWTQSPARFDLVSASKRSRLPAGHSFFMS